MTKSFLSSAEWEQICLDICSQSFQQQLCCKRSCSKLSGDSVAHQAHILNYVFLRGLVCNLINCGNVVGRMSQLSVAPPVNPRRKSLGLITVCFPISAPSSQHSSYQSVSHISQKKAVRSIVSHSCSNYGFVFLSAVVHLDLAAKQKEMLSKHSEALRIATNCWYNGRLCQSALRYSETEVKNAKTYKVSYQLHYKHYNWALPHVDSFMVNHWGQCPASASCQ